MLDTLEKAQENDLGLVHNYINWMLLVNWLGVKLATLAFPKFWFQVGPKDYFGQSMHLRAAAAAWLLPAGAVTTLVTHGFSNFLKKSLCTDRGGRCAGLDSDLDKGEDKNHLLLVLAVAVSASSGEYLITAQEAAVISCPATIPAVTHWGLCAAECSPWMMNSFPVPVPERSIVQCKCTQLHSQRCSQCWHFHLHVLLLSPPIWSSDPPGSSSQGYPADEQR